MSETRSCAKSQTPVFAPGVSFTPPSPRSTSDDNARVPSPGRFADMGMDIQDVLQRYSLKHDVLLPSLVIQLLML